MAKKSKGGTRQPKVHVQYYSTGTGRLSGREIKADKRLKELTAKYQLDGYSEVEARDRARKELRDNARGDWRA